MKNPDRTKNRSTPHQPTFTRGKMARAGPMHRSPEAAVIKLAEVGQQDEQNRQAPDAVQGGYVTGLTRRSGGMGWVAGD